MKTRTITITLARVYEDIDALTFKYADASTIPSPKQNNAYQSDSKEAHDGHILARHVEFRDAVLRNSLLWHLTPPETEVTSETDALSTDTILTYNFKTEDDFNDILLRPIAIYIHRFLVWGALYDWYASGMGDRQAQVYAAELDSLVEDIKKNLRGKSYGRRPLQPFGPANVITED